MKVKSLFYWVILVVIAFGTGAFLLQELTSPKNAFPNTENINLSEQTSPIKIILTGDIMLDRGVKIAIENQGGGDYKFPF